MAVKVDELIAAEVRKIKVSELQPGDITIQGMMDEHGISEAQARRIGDMVLGPLVIGGEMVKIKCRNPQGGGAINAWRLVVKNEKKG